MPMDDPLDRRQPDSRAFKLAFRMQALKGAKQLVLVGHVKARAVVTNEKCAFTAKSVSENSAGSCFRAKGRMARRNEGEYPPWIFD